jgi:lipopolysaccharide transport system permease protein
MTSLITNLWRHRELCMSLTRREVSARYKQSLLGPAWAILQPLALLAVFTAVQRFIHIPSEGLPYPVFVYAGLVPWTFFAGTLAMMTPSIVANASIVRKIYFPREVLPFSSALVGLVDLAVALTTLFLLMAYYAVPPGASAAYVLIIVLIELVFVTGIGLFTAAVCAFQRDILFVAVFVLQLWMFLSPVLYPLSAVPPEWRTLYLANPMASIITLFRDSMFGMNPVDLRMLGVAAAEAVVTLFLGYGFFKSVEKYFADAV